MKHYCSREPPRLKCVTLLEERYMSAARIADCPTRKKVADERKRLDGIARREQLTPGWLAGALRDAEVSIEEVVH